MPKGKALANGGRRRNAKSVRRKKDVEGMETEEAEDISVQSGEEGGEDGESNGRDRSKKGKSSSDKRKRKDEDEQAKAEDEEARDEEEESTEDACKGQFDGKCLYEVLGVEKTATLTEIKKQYHRMALRLHPDKNPGDESAKNNFQTLQKVFSILGDEEKRKIYDETGRTDDAELSGEKFSNLYEYYRTVYCRVTDDDIVAYERSYRGSDEEAADVKEFYAKFDGNMEKAFLYIICSREELDSHRFKDIIDAAIAAGELKSYPRYQRWAKQVATKPAPKDPLRAAGSSKKGRAKGKAKEEEDSGALVAMIKSRWKERENSLLEMLEKKYGGAEPGKKGKGKGLNDRNGALSKREREVVDEEPTEEEFLKARARLFDKASASSPAEEENQNAGKKQKRRKKN